LRRGADNAAMNVRLRNHFLIAMPGMEDSIFAHSITYLCEHNEHGAMGIVVNRPLELSFDDIFNWRFRACAHHDRLVLAG
jgi:putative transcriptional regulator